MIYVVSICLVFSHIAFNNIVSSCTISLTETIFYNSENKGLKISKIDKNSSGESFNWIRLALC